MQTAQTAIGMVVVKCHSRKTHHHGFVQLRTQLLDITSRNIRVRGFDEGLSIYDLLDLDAEGDDEIDDGASKVDPSTKDALL